MFGEIDFAFIDVFSLMKVHFEKINRETIDKYISQCYI